MLAATGGALFAGCSSFGLGDGADWSATLPGDYVARRPSVDGDRVAVAAEDGLLYVLDAESGEVVGDGYERGGGLASHAGTTPIPTDEGFLSATDQAPSDGLGQLVLRSRAGERRWRSELAGGAPVNPAVSPMTFDGSVYFARFDTPGLLAVDAPARKMEQVGDFVLTSESWDRSGSRVVAGTRNWDLAVVDLATGEETWRVDANTTPHPRWYDGDVLTQTYDDAVFVERVVPGDGTRRWRAEVPGVSVRDSTMVDASTFAVATAFGTDETRSARISFIDPDSGNLLGGHTFEYESLDYRGMAAADGRLYVTGNRNREQGELRSLVPDDASETVATVGGRVSSAPAVADGTAVFGGGDPTAVYAVRFD